jgi:hypothetical protein
MSNVTNSIARVMEFVGNLLKLVRWGNLPNLQPFVEGDEPKRIGGEFEKFAANGFRMVTNIIHLGKVVVDRTKPFGPAGLGWTIWKGPADGDGLTGEEEQDAQALALTEIDITTLLFETAHLENEMGINGEEMLRRFRESGWILHDAVFGQALLDEPYRVTLEMLRITRGIKLFALPGTVLLNSSGSRCVLCLSWDRGVWDWHVRELDEYWGPRCRSAVSASSSPASVPVS